MLMKLIEFYNGEGTFKDVVDQECNVVEIKPHTDDDGNVMSIEIKYVPKKIEKKGRF